MTFFRKIRKNFFKAQYIFALLGIIFLFGAFLRFYHLNWDEGLGFHPDERNIIKAVQNIRIPGQLNPHFFAYGGFPVYLIRLISQGVHLVSQNDSIYDYGNLNLIGRSLSALLSTFSILLIYILGRKLTAQKTGLLAAFLFAFSPGLIQSAHYSVTESWLIFFLLLITLSGLKIYENPELKNWLLMAIVCGLALGTKISAAIFLIIPLIVWTLIWRKKLANIFWGLIFILTLGLIYFVSSPYSLLDFRSFYNSLVYEFLTATGKINVPYTLQFLNTKPYLFFIENLFWQTNLILPVLGLFALVFWLIHSFKTKNLKSVPFLLFGLIFFVYVGSWQTKFIRYMLPFIPVLILAASWLTVKILSHKKLVYWGFGLTTLLVMLTLFWTLAFMRIYAKESTRITASKWIYQNIPKDSAIVVEHWDDPLPVILEGENPQEYRSKVMRNFDPETSSKINQMTQTLADGDYLILASRRLSGAISKDTRNYPVTSQYYQKLFAGELGYTLVLETSSYPRLWKWEIIDDKAEETFQVFDHPVVKIFKNTQKLKETEIKKILEGQL